MRLRIVDQAFPLTSDRMTVGRSRSCDIRLKEDSVSRLHAAFYRQGDALVLEDMGSSNGTFLNSERVAGPRLVTLGDVVRFGALRGVLEDPEAPRNATATPSAESAVDYTIGVVPGLPAGLGWRLLALVTDLILFTFGSLVPFAPLAIVVFVERRLLAPAALPPSAETMGILAGGCSALWVLYAWYYVVHGWARRGGTPGLRLCGLRLVDWRQRTPIGYPRALLRTVSTVVTLATFGLGFLVTAFRRDRKSLHDLLAGTMVVHRARPLGQRAAGA